MFMPPSGLALLKRIQIRRLVIAAIVNHMLTAMSQVRIRADTVSRVHSLCYVLIKVT
jgi:hypothetical protein